MMRRTYRKSFRMLSCFLVNVFLLSLFPTSSHSLSINPQVPGSVTIGAVEQTNKANEGVYRFLQKHFTNPYKAATNEIDRISALVGKALKYLQNIDYDESEFVKLVTRSPKSYSTYDLVDITIASGVISDQDMEPLLKDGSLLKSFLMANNYINKPKEGTDASKYKISESFIKNANQIETLTFDVSYEDYVELTGLNLSEESFDKQLKELKDESVNQKILLLLKSNLVEGTKPFNHFMIRTHHPGTHFGRLDPEDFYEDGVVYGGGVRYMTEGKLMSYPKIAKEINAILPQADQLGLNYEQMKELFSGYLQGETEALASGMYKKLITILEPFLGAKGLVIAIDFKQVEGKWTTVSPHSQAKLPHNFSRVFNAYGHFWAKSLGENILNDKPAPDMDTSGAEMVQILQGALEHHLKDTGENSNWNLIKTLDSEREAVVRAASNHNSKSILRLYPILKAIDGLRKEGGYESESDFIKKLENTFTKSDLNVKDPQEVELFGLFLKRLKSGMEIEGFTGRKTTSETILSLAAAAYFDALNGYEVYKKEDGSLDFHTTQTYYNVPVPVKELGLITGKSILYGGMLGRRQATGDGVIDSSKEFMRGFIDKAFRLYNQKVQLPEDTSEIVKMIFNTITQANQDYKSNNNFEVLKSKNKSILPFVYLQYRAALLEHNGDLEKAIAAIKKKPLAGIQQGTQGMGNVASFLHKKASKEGMISLLFNDASAVLTLKGYEAVAKELSEISDASQLLGSISNNGLLVALSKNNESFKKIQEVSDKVVAWAVSHPKKRKYKLLANYYYYELKKEYGEVIEPLGPVTYVDEDEGIDFNLDETKKDLAERTKELLKFGTEMLFLAASEGQVREDNFEEVKTFLIAEPANGPTTPAAKRGLYFNGIEIIPDSAINGGGVNISDEEREQALIGKRFSIEEALEKLERKQANGARAMVEARKTLNQPFYILVPLMNFIHSHFRYQFANGNYYESLKNSILINAAKERKSMIDGKIKEVLEYIDDFLKNNGNVSYFTKEFVYNINFEQALVFQKLVRPEALTDRGLDDLRGALSNLIKYTNNDSEFYGDIKEFLKNILILSSLDVQDKRVVLVQMAIEILDKNSQNVGLLDSVDLGRSFLNDSASTESDVSEVFPNHTYVIKAA